MQADFYRIYTARIGGEKGYYGEEEESGECGMSGEERQAKGGWYGGFKEAEGMYGLSSYSFQFSISFGSVVLSVW